VSLILLSRPGCHLCEEFLDALQDAFPQVAVAKACVDDDPDWRARYGSLIPVLLAPDGTELCRVRLDTAQVQEWISAGNRQ
jgi:hypothetical protein